MSTPATLIQHCRKWLLLPCFSLLAACTPPPEQQLLEGTAQTSLLPAHRDFALAAKQLSQATQAFCKSPDDAGLQAAQEHWRHSAVAWSGLQVKSFGPL
ncbi:MAG: imelysin family protein, partial [Pseudomonadota bacterium]|nr:imelysin family protein [Pseudomonadota bacterium]